MVVEGACVQWSLCGFTGGANCLRSTQCPHPTVGEWSSCAEGSACADGNSHAQGGQSRTPVPTKEKMRAGRSARDEIQVLLYALRGEKSPIGGICNPSVAPHLNRKPLREVRSEFSLSVIGAAGRSSGTLANFFL